MTTAVCSPPPSPPFCADQYRYTKELLALQRCGAVPPKVVPTALSTDMSPLDWQEWAKALAAHPDKQFAKYIVNGIRVGFRVGYNHGRSCVGASRNMQSARVYLDEERAKGRVLGPVRPSDIPQVHTSRFGVIPKKGVNKWRLILDLSSPEDRSVNDGIQPDLCSLSYVSVDDAARIIVQAGRGALLAKVDIKSAYRLVPVHPEDRLLLGMAWEGEVFVDNVLPFGLRSAPKIFTALADALEWVVRQAGVEEVMHYLDDFLIVGAPDSDQCMVDLQRLLRVFDRLQ